MPLVPGTYRHYKGQRYRVLGTAQHSETMEPLVVYQALYGDYGLWVRPAAMFVETIELEGEPIPRFALEQADSRDSIADVDTQTWSSKTHLELKS